MNNRLNGYYYVISSTHFGLCQGKKVIHFVTRGGAYSEEPLSALELGYRYLRTILGFLGIRDFTTVAIEKMDVIGADVEAVVTEAIKDAHEKAKNF